MLTFRQFLVRLGKASPPVYLNNGLTFSFGLVGAACCLAAASPAKALTITAVDQGWYSNNLPHDPTNINYIVGTVNANKYRDFFVFSLPNSPISSASLTINAALVSSASQNVSLFGFSGSIDDLVSGASSYSALGQGPSFASLIYNTSDSNSTKTFTFNSAGVSYLNSLTGGRAAITGDNPSGGYVYAASSLPPTLTLTVGSSESVKGSFLSEQDSFQSVPGPLPVFGAAAAFQASRRLKSRIRQSSLNKTNGSIRLGRVGIDA